MTDQVLTPEEVGKACRTGVLVARQRGHTITGQPVIGRQPTSQCDVVVVTLPVGAQWVHVVLEIIWKEEQRYLRTQHVHLGGKDADDCHICDEYHTYELYYEEEEEEEHQCEGGTYWEDDGKGGFDPCESFDTTWYESGFLLTGSAGWYCPTHLGQVYEEDLATVRRARERAEQRRQKESHG